jgi:hypothetical protein
MQNASDRSSDCDPDPAMWIMGLILGAIVGGSLLIMSAAAYMAPTT